MKTKFIALMLMLTGIGIALLYGNLPPVVTNVTSVQRTDGSKTVDIYYNVADAESDSLEITLQVSEDSGISYTIVPLASQLAGDIGRGVAAGTGKHIIWNAGTGSRTYDGASFVFKVIAEDNFNMVLVQGGTFHNGTSDVTVTSFYIDKYELTQAVYQAVMGSNPSYFTGVLNGPVEQVSWFNAIEYCNRRSLREGITPCYSYGSFGTNPANWPAGWNTNAANHTNVSCDWVAQGYRLPSEMEWMFAARGGNQTHNYNYSGSNDINAVGWYTSNSGSATHTVGTKAANELGLYDMSGNVWEWNWDIYGSYASGAQNNPHGDVSGSYRELIGGGWNSDAANCVVSGRSLADATYISSHLSFRICRSADNFVLVQGGTFNNGTSDVTVSSFYIDKFELTQAGYQTVMGSNPAYHTGDVSNPVEQVSWFDAIEYCNRRSISEGLTPCYSYSSAGTNPASWPAGWNSTATNHANVACDWTANGYRLPSEAEWQYAARGGNQTHNYTYSGSNTINGVAWYTHNSGSTAHTVGTKAANEMGIYDMSGNVWEWNWDIYGSYPSGSQNNPYGALNGSNRVLCGGGWNDNDFDCTISSRYPLNAAYIGYTLGFRLCRKAQ